MKKVTAHTILAVEFIRAVRTFSKAITLLAAWDAGSIITPELIQATCTHGYKTHMNRFPQYLNKNLTSFRLPQTHGLISH